MKETNFEDHSLYIPFVQIGWAVSFFVNFVGCVVQIAAMRDIVLLKSSRTASDVIILGLMMAGLAFSSTCGFQCIVNGVAGVFAYGKPACIFEAYFHSVTFTAVILAHVLFAAHCYLGIVHRITLSSRQVILIMSITDFVLLAGTGSLVYFEHLAPIFLSPGGFFCFFDFRAPFTLFYWVPLFCLSFSAIFLFYLLIYRHTAESSEQLTRGSTTLLGNNTSRRLAKRAAYLLSTLLAFLPMLISLCLTWFNTEPPAMFVAFAGVCADFHGIIGPLVYAIQNPRLHTFSKIPCLVRLQRNRSASFSVNPSTRFTSHRGTFRSLRDTLAPALPPTLPPTALRKDTMPFDPSLFPYIPPSPSCSPSCSSSSTSSSSSTASAQRHPMADPGSSSLTPLLSSEPREEEEEVGEEDSLPSQPLLQEFPPEPSSSSTGLVVEFEQDLDLLPEDAQQTQELPQGLPPQGLEQQQEEEPPEVGPI